MKKLAGFAVATLLITASVTEAKGPILSLRSLFGGQVPTASLGAPDNEPTFASPGGPTLGTPPEVLPSPDGYGPLTISPVPAGPGIKLHPARYKDLCHIHPCAVKTIIEVKDPCFRYRPRCDCNPPPMVCIEVCLPPGCPRITGTRDLGHVKYNYGDYQVEITSRHGRVVVDYDD